MKPSIGSGKAGSLRSVTLFVALFSFIASLSWALDCPNCGRTNLPSLVMVCPQCQAMVHTAEVQAKQKCNSTLAIEVYYTGKRCDQLPTKGAILLNRKLTGDLPLIDRADRAGLVLSGVDREGLGVDYTAVYRGEVHGLREGVYDLQIEMSLPWLTEHLRQNRRVVFPRIGLKQGQTTLVRHIFRSPGTFSNRPKPADEQAHPSVTLLSPLRKGVDKKVSEPVIPPLASDTFKSWKRDDDVIPRPEIRMGSGTLGLDLPVF